MRNVTWHYLGIADIKDGSEFIEECVEPYLFVTFTCWLVKHCYFTYWSGVRSQGAIFPLNVSALLSGVIKPYPRFAFLVSTWESPKIAP